WGLALAGKARGLDAGGWFDAPVGAEEDAKSISHETTYSKDNTDVALMEATLARLSQMVGRRMRESGLHGRTVELKLRYSDFSTITRARTLAESTQLDNAIFEAVRELFHQNRRPGRAVRLLGVKVSHLSREEGQLDLLDGARKDKWRRALAVADRLRDRFGERSVELAGGLEYGWKERVHENPAGLPGKRRGPGRKQEAD
ncbi:MAG: DNA polymerase IV, partial [Acidobacteria bacterium]|nr:DNA polymerase IV [Acidobacteriota bacterium]